uniref:Meiotic nuclear divisions 1 n=1 Tax=Bos taurus TaxID=9913 RepID=A0A3Q1MJT7_BOVIN
RQRRGLKTSSEKKVGLHSAPRTENGSSCESLSASLWSADGRDQAGPAPRIGPAHPDRPLAAAAARGRCAPQERGLVFLPLLAAPPAGRCRRQNQTQPSRPRPSPRAGPAAGRRAAGAMLSEGNQKYANLQKSIEKAKVGRHETEERTMLAKELSSLRDQREQLKAEVEKYRECDPQVVEEIRQANQVAKEAANRWTDNIFAIKSWAKRKFGFEENKIDKNFGIPEDFDYID